MAILSKVLIPIDFSERCLGAARYAISLAERFHSRLLSFTLNRGLAPAQI